MTLIEMVHTEIEEQVKKASTSSNKKDHLEAVGTIKSLFERLSYLTVEQVEWDFNQLQIACKAAVST